MVIFENDVVFTVTDTIIKSRLRNFGKRFSSPTAHRWSVGHLGSTIAAIALSASSAHAGLTGPAIGLLAPSAFGLFREELEG